MDSLIDPELSFKLTFTLSWFLIALGVIKLGIFLLGEIAPKLYSRFKSEGVRNFMTGKGNRLLFGLGGLLTALLGGVFLGLAFLLRFLYEATATL